MAPFDQTGFELAPAMKPSRELVPDLPAPVDPVLAKLIAARALIEKPEHWCKIHTDREDGARCIQGALYAVHVFGGPIREALIEALPPKFIEPVLRNISLMMFNDHLDTTHADVLSLFDRAIAARKAA